MRPPRSSVSIARVLSQCSLRPVFAAPLKVSRELNEAKRPPVSEVSSFCSLTFGPPIVSEMNEMPSPRIDDELLRKIHAGDRAVFSSLVREHQRSVFFTAMRLSSGDEASARDIVQKAFLQAWTHREKFRGQASFKTWLLRITTNVAKNEQRRAWRRREFTPGEGTEEDFEPLTPEAETSFVASRPLPRPAWMRLE